MNFFEENVMAESDNILTKLEDLLLYLIPQLSKFPRDQKFVLGYRIETKVLDVQEFCLRAYYSRDKRGHLLEANLQLEVARHLVRLANAFCTNLTNVVISGVSEVGPYAFANCPTLTSVFFQGNAPAEANVGSEEFTFDPSVTVYYLPWTTGWRTNWYYYSSAVPTILWNPTIQTGDGRFGLQGNRFGFNVTCTANIPVTVDACMSLSSPNWTSMQAVTLSNGLYYFSDPAWTNCMGRFYRISSP